MSMLTKVLHELCPDEPAAANNHNLHAESPRTAGRRSRTHSGLMRDCDDATPVRDNGSSRANGANGANGANRGATAHEAPGPAGTSRAPASDQIAGKTGG